MTDLLSRLLAERPWLLADGATGTNLFAMGLGHGDAPELWNLEHPERVRRHYRSFMEAGSDLVLTNTFGGNSKRLKLHRAEDRVAEINTAAAALAREEAQARDRPIVVAGSMGPTGELFQPLGPLSLEEGAEVFAAQARALAAGGAEVLWVETISSVDELRAAVAGAARTDLPVVCTLSFDTHGRTMMGVTPAQLAGIVRELEPRPLAYGANCGVGAAELVAAILNMRSAAGPGDVLVAKSNCGIPRFVEGEIRYSGTPELMADYACLVRDAGARIIGGCCGTTAEHVRAMREALERRPPGEAPPVETVVARLGQVSAGAEAQGRGGPAGEVRQGSAAGRSRRRRRAADGGSLADS